MTTPELSFQINRHDVSYKALFSQPQFGLASAARSLHFLFSRLNPLGLRLADMKIEGNLTNLPDFAISCAFPTISCTLRLRLETLEFNAFSPASDAPLSEIVTAGLTAVSEIGGTAFTGVAAHEVIWAAHGTLGVSLSDYLKRFLVDNPWGHPAGVGFNLGPDPAKACLSAYTTVAPSAVLSGALFVQITAAYEGRVSVPELRDRFRELMRVTAGRLHLALPGASTDG